MASLGTKIQSRRERPRASQHGISLQKRQEIRDAFDTDGSANTAASRGPHAPRYGRHTSNSGGGGMVVLSRSKGVPKLSVPPPLNLPSLRKEHEKFDSNGSSSIPGRQGLEHGPGSSTMGWTKPVVVKDPSVPDPGLGSRPGGPSLAPSTTQGVIEKAAILKGEDFPTLRAAVYTPPSKQREGSSRIEKKKITGEEGMEKRPLSPMLMDMRPQMRPLRTDVGNLSNKRDSAGLEKQRKTDELLSSLPRVDYKSDWEDDERKTGLSLPERDFGGKHEPTNGTNVRDVEIVASKEVFRGDPFGKYSTYVNKDSRENVWRSSGMNQRGDQYGPHESDKNDETRPYSAGRGNNTQSIYSGNRDWHSKRDPVSQTFNHMGAEEHSTGWHRGNMFQNNSGSKAYSSPLNKNKGLMGNDVLDIRREKHTTLRPAKPVTYLEDVDDFRDVNVKLLKKKKDLQKPTEFHDPVRESFEVELGLILRRQEIERQQAMEQRSRALEMARREDEERERRVREERERREREEEELRRASWLAEQEKLEVARRAEEQRVAREEEKKQLLLEEERRKEAARKKLLELEARIARRQAEAHAQGESNGVSFGDREDGERETDHLRTGSSDSSSMNRYFDNASNLDAVSRWSNMKDVVSNSNSTLLDRGESHPYYGTHNPFQDQEYPYRSRQEVFGPGPVRRSYGRKDQQPYDSTRMPRWWNNPDVNKPQSDFELDYLEGDRLVDAGWSSPSNSMGSPHAQYDGSESFSSFTRYRYGSRQPRVLPPPAVTTMFRGPITEQTIGGDDAHTMGTSYVDAYQETSQLHITEPSVVESESYVASAPTHLEQSEEKASARCDSQSSLSVSSSPISPQHIAHDEMDVSGDLLAPPTSAETPQSYNENGEIDGASNISGTITEVVDDEWGLEENAHGMNHTEKNEGEEEKGDAGAVNVGEPDLDLQQDFGVVAGDTEQVILGFDEGVEVQIPRISSGFESQQVVEMDSVPKSILDLSLEQPIKSVSSPLMPSQDKVANISGLSAPIVPPVKPIMPPSSMQAVSSQAELPLNVHFGLFSGPSLIPTPIPAIQIGSIQMPIYFQTQMPPSISQIHPSTAPLLQFGEINYAPSVVSQGINPVPTQPIQSIVHPAGPSNSYSANQSQNSTSTPSQTNPETLLSSSQKSTIEALHSSVPTEKPKESTSLVSSDDKELVVQPQPSNNKTTVSNGSEGPIIVSTGVRGRRYGPNNNNNNPPKEPNMRFAPAGSEVSRRDPRGGHQRVRRNIRRTELWVRKDSEKREKPASEIPIQGMSNERNGENSTGASTVGLKDTSRPKDDVLESGVVRVFEQPGIEVPTDADGFIEVRSKKQMLNDRREKREKEKEREIRPKPRMQKVFRKQNTGAVARSLGPNFSRSTKEFIDSTGKNLTKVQPSVQLTGSSTSKSLPPIGTPVQKLSRPDARLSSSKTSQPAKIGTGLSFEGTTAAEKHLALGCWESSHANLQMDPAIKPVQVEQQAGANTFPLEPSKLIVSSQPESGPINSLLAGEKIQFGVVTSPMIPVSRPATQNVLGAPSSSGPLPSLHMLDKATAEKPVVVSMKEVAEEEAEAAVSALARAAISADDVVVGTVVDASVSAEQKNISCADGPGSTSGAPADQGAQTQSTSTEESSSLTVALPADLSVDTPSLTMWPPLTSPQSTGPNPLLSQFPGAQPSHFSRFEMNPMLSGHHIFAFGPHDESAAQRAAAGQLGTWSGPHPSSVDSFYRPPVGYDSPFIGPAAIQGPSHMVVYNHFTPVGQFGQVGMSFVGPPTYTPTENHPKWK